MIIEILTPILLTIGGIIFWALKESLNSEAKSREYKIETYKFTVHGSYSKSGQVVHNSSLNKKQLKFYSVIVPHNRYN